MFWETVKISKQNSVDDVVTSDSSTTLFCQHTLSSVLSRHSHSPYRNVCSFFRAIISLLPYSAPSAIDLTTQRVLFLDTTTTDNGLATLRQSPFFYVFFSMCLPFVDRGDNWDWNTKRKMKQKEAERKRKVNCLKCFNRTLNYHTIRFHKSEKWTNPLMKGRLSWPILSLTSFLK
jgi:hypothetical protein